jgi:Beta-propeller repeat
MKVRLLALILLRPASPPRISVANHLSIRHLLAFTVAAAAFPDAVVHTSGAPDKSDRRPHLTSVVSESARAAYFRLPLRFEPVPGKTGDDFVARGSGYSVSVSAAGAALLLREQSGERPRRLTMSLAGGNRRAHANPRRALPGVSNYLIGNDTGAWVTGVRGYGEIEYPGVYRGVDIVYYGNQQKLEYDFVVAPGAGPEAIALAFDGATRWSVSPQGDLVIATDGGKLVQHRPEIYQNDHGARRTIRGGYIMRRDGTVGFRVGKYDRRLPLIIDPVLSYATYLGGVNQERGNGVAVDAAGNVIVAGVTYSPDFPVMNPVQPQRTGFGDAFVLKLNPTGDAIVYSTYFGGTQNDVARDVAVDDSGNAYVAGYTESWDFPASTKIGPSGDRDGIFVLKFDPAGGLVYSTRTGGSGGDDVNGIAVDTEGRAHIAGMTFSADFPVVNPWQGSLGGYPAFRTRDGGEWLGLKSGLQVSGVGAFAFDPSQPGTVYAGSVREGLFKTTDDGATWTRANLPPQRIYAIAAQDATVFAAGDGGLCRSRDHGETWTVVSPYQLVTAVAVTRESPSAIYVGMGWSANVLKSMDGGDTWIDTGLAGPVQLLAASGSTVYAVTGNTVYRSSGGGPWIAASGSSRDVLYGMVTALAVDPADPQVAYAGTTDGLFKTTSGGAAWTPVWGFTSWIGVIAIAPSDPSTVFVASSMGSGISHDGGQTWLLSGLGDVAQLATVTFDPADSAHVYAGCYMGADAFVATLSADGSRLEYATFIGGTRSEAATGIAVDPSGNRYVTGDTFSEDFPTVRPIQSAFGGVWDSFVVKISPAGVPVYSTYLGGWATDYNARITADTAGRAYVTGLTLSMNFPIVNAWQSAHGGGYSDVFVTALNEEGSAFVYSTYLGGSGMENDTTQSLGPSIAVTPAGEEAVTGTTQSTNFPVTPDAWHRTHAGGVTDVFVSRFDATGALQYSTFLGGQGADYGRDIAVDANSAMIIAGYTDSTDWATRTAVQPVYAGSEDAFVVKISPETAPPDTVAPTTTIAVSGTAGIPGWYKSPVTVSLSSVDNDQGRGVATIEYSLNGGGFKRYTTPFMVTASGTTRITARATDWAGNVENPLPSTTVAIDTTAPAVGSQCRERSALPAGTSPP